ncbi:MAG: ATP-binding protein [Candidatus Humimicrobiaceae bacterium]
MEGKTYIACAFGNCACCNEYRVSYFRIPELLLEIQDAKNQNRFLKFIGQDTLRLHLQQQLLLNKCSYFCKLFFYAL